jgi:hypothetical protein
MVKTQFITLFVLSCFSGSPAALAAISDNCRNNPSSCSASETNQLVNEALEETCGAVYGLTKGSEGYTQCLKMLGYRD